MYRQEKQKQKEKQQAVEEGDGAGVRVQTVHRREIESHNLLIPLHSLKLQHIIGEGKGITHMYTYTHVIRTYLCIYIYTI